MTSPVEHDRIQARQRLKGVLGELEKCLEQREKHLKERAKPADSQLRREQRNLQLGMAALTDNLIEYGELLVKLTSSDVSRRLLESFRDWSHDVELRESLWRLWEEQMDPALREVRPPIQMGTELLQEAESLRPSISGLQWQLAPLLHYERELIAARQDKEAQAEAIAMAKKVGYEPSRLAAAIQGYSGPGSTTVAAAASLQPPGSEGRKSVSATSVPRASASTNAAMALPVSAGSSRRRR
ncbi:hypothetical protein [Streptomyces sp. NPDC048277]|uniref:hypothetical protein n=1 Tax=Streptomyces sp. NPDC048277 TaxID=3155027 RepID=UPI0033D43531